MPENFKFSFDGNLASKGVLDAYDASRSFMGSARVFQIMAHYYATGKIIHHAPSSSVQVTLSSPRKGSFIYDLAVGVTGGVLTIPFGIFVERLFDKWFPPENPAMKAVLAQLEEHSRLLRRLSDADLRPKSDAAADTVETLIEERDPEIQVLRSITANSFKDIFRPIGKSADRVSITFGEFDEPIAALDEEAVDKLENETTDDHDSTIVGIVDSFSRNSKSGVIFSKELRRGALFTFVSPKSLPPGDDFSWSQYTRNPIELTGRYIRFFDKSVKRFLAYECRRVPTQ